MEDDIRTRTSAGEGEETPHPSGGACNENGLPLQIVHAAIVSFSNTTNFILFLTSFFEGDTMIWSFQPQLRKV
jgi:hypothetical protein